MQPRVAVAILAVRNPELLAESLDSIERHRSGEPEHQVVLVLNEATDEVRAVAQRYADRVVIIDSPVNLGTGGGFNRAFAATNAPFMVIAHDDSLVTPGWLRPLVTRMEEDPGLGAVGGRIVDLNGRVRWMGGVVFRDGSTRPEWVGDDPPASLVHAPREVAYHGGLGLLIRREAWQAVGGFDDRSFYPAYYSDADFCFRLRAAGWAVRYEPASVVRHHMGRTTTSAFRAFVVARNRAEFARLHADQLAHHAAAAHGDLRAVAAEVERVAASSPAVSPPAGADGDAAARLGERLDRPMLDYARMDRDVWREFATRQAERPEPVERAAREAEAARRTWRHAARSAGEDRDRWRARAADLSAHIEVMAARLESTADALERTTRTLEGVVGSRWWRLGERLRRLRRLRR